LAVRIAHDWVFALSRGACGPTFGLLANDGRHIRALIRDGMMARTLNTAVLEMKRAPYGAQSYPLKLWSLPLSATSGATSLSFEAIFWLRAWQVFLTTWQTINSVISRADAMMHMGLDKCKWSFK
jgi:hypothetical protein